MPEKRYRDDPEKRKAYLLGAYEQVVRLSESPRFRGKRQLDALIAEGERLRASLTEHGVRFER